MTKTKLAYQSTEEYLVKAYEKAETDALKAGKSASDAKNDACNYMKKALDKIKEELAKVEPNNLNPQSKYVKENPKSTENPKSLNFDFKELPLP